MYYLNLSDYLEISSTILTIIAAILISIPRKISLYIFIFASLSWIIFGLLNHKYFFVTQNIVLIGFDIYGIYNWTKKGIQ